MDVQIRDAKLSDKSLLRHLVELYMYDFSELNGRDVDEHGLFGYRFLDHYWTEPSRRPSLITVDNRLTIPSSFEEATTATGWIQRFRTP